MVKVLSCAIENIEPKISEFLIRLKAISGFCINAGKYAQ